MPTDHPGLSPFPSSDSFIPKKELICFWQLLNNPLWLTTQENLKKINGRRIWGLGEIAIYDTAGKLITGSKVSSEGIPKHYNNELTYLSDGYSWGRKILSERDWMMGLAKRRPLDEQLSYINAELASAHTYWNWLLSRIIIGTLVIIFLVFLGVVLLFQRSQRQQLLVEQGARINRDLHDELGSSLGGITLLADELALMKDNTLLAADLDDLSLMAREANASLREVVWHGVGKDILIGALLQSLFSRAERVVRGVTFKTAMPLNIPEIIVSLSMKRHLTLFFKEVIHNCARHSKATELSLSARCDDGELIIEISDNGGGFDPSKVNDGWGLKNLRARAEEISGNLQIDTELGRGTAVRLQLMLSSLTKEPKYNYQTSN